MRVRGDAVSAREKESHALAPAKAGTLGPVLHGPADFIKDISVENVFNALTAFTFAASGPIAIILSVGAKGELSEAQIASWIFGVFVINGAISIIFCLAYRQPLVFLWTIPGAVLVGTALSHSSFSEVIGAFFAAGLLMLILGLSGSARRTLEMIPMPIVMAMVAGVFLQFVLDWIYAFGSSLWLAASMTAAFAAASSMPRAMRNLPPIIAALVAGLISVLALGEFQTEGITFALATPQLQAPQFSFGAMIELVVPLAITVLIVQNGQGVAVLKSAGHEPPVNSIAVACGAGSIAAAAAGAVSTCLTGPVNAIISGGSDKKTQYTAGVVIGALAIFFGVCAPTFTQLMLAMPAAFIAALAGLAILRVLQNAFVTAFNSDFALGALVTFVVTIADFSILNIGAPFWGLMFGFAASWLVERNSFSGRNEN